MDRHDMKKPALNATEVSDLVATLFGLKVSRIKSLPSFMDQNLHVQASVSGETADHGSAEYVLKILNCEESKEADLIEVQTQAMLFLKAEGFPTPAVVLTKEGNIISLESIDYGSERRKHIVRLLTYLPGTPMAQISVGPHILYELGKLGANMDKILQKKFHHPMVKRLHRKQYIWDFANFPHLEKFLHVLEKKKHRKAVDQVIQQFKDSLAPQLKHFRPCINHGDLSTTNVLLEPSNEAAGNPHPQYKVSGVLDFGNMSYGCYVFEVAIAIMYAMTASKEPLQVGGHILAGYESVVPLTEIERDALFLLVSCRFCLSLVLNTHAFQLDPTNEEYLMGSIKKKWKCFLQLLDMGKENVEKIWFQTARSYLFIYLFILSFSIPAFTIDIASCRFTINKWIGNKKGKN
ncbi:hydroxylysine kinase-like isoform X2 [Rhinatrema bivittatum]|nr:hydroxylysine kinase-like isoform X2 [Rhinatrema bivittatum]XP_029456998.1 hydroxylysine kinase-like isoform X2 [Rhinatrema bivittatum]